MNEVIRLTRLAMLLQILINCVMAISSSRGAFLFSLDSLILILAITLPSLVVLLATVVVQHRGWNYAEVTAGGVPLREIDYRTMQSRKIPGLYLAGEVLDCDGRIGGFNFQWAWSTGYLAGRAAAQRG